MRSKLPAIALTTGCLTAAGLGGYLAVRTGTDTVASESPAVTAATAPGSPAEDHVAPVPARRPSAPVATSSAQSARTSTRSTSQTITPSSTPPAMEPAASTAEPMEASKSEVTDVAAAASSHAGPSADPVAAEAESRPAFMDVDLPLDAVVGIRLETAVSSETSQLEDRVVGRVTREVTIDGRTVVPAGAELAGHVTTVQRGGKVRERARIGIRFTSLTIDDVRVPIQTEAILRDGEAPGGEATAKIGASAVIGSILGGMFGGGKGAAIGGAAGAAGGTAVVMKGDRNAATIAAGTALTVRLAAPATVRVKQ